VGILIIDARNAFNEQNRTVMLWVVRHEWPSGARFTFNCYHHWCTLVIRGKDGNGAVIIFSKEGVVQGDPLSMFAYGIGILPLIRQLKKEFPLVEQPWYADDAGAGGKFDRMRSQFLRLVELGPTFGYFPESTKSVLIVAQHNLERAKSVFADLDFKVSTGERYLGGFIGESSAQDEWLDRKIQHWSQAVTSLAAAAVKFPQSAYSGLQRSLQQEWQFVQRVVRNIEISGRGEGIESYLPSSPLQRYDRQQ
jgi:hypothetical protein